MSESPLAEQEPRRQRVSRPTPAHLFQQRQAAEPPGSSEVAAPAPRATRVIPALAGIDVPASGTPTTEPVPDYPPDLVFIVRDDGKVLFVNRALGQRAEDDVIGSEIYDWVFPEQHQVVRECLGRVFSSGRGDRHELNGLQQHDPDAWYECRVSANLRDGKVVSATIIARDVTRFKQAEIALRAAFAEKEQLLEERTADLDTAKRDMARRPSDGDTARRELERFRAVVDEAGEAMFVTDSATRRVVDVNETACRWLRQERAEVIGRAADELGIEFQVVPPESADLVFTETRDARRPFVLDGGVHRRTDGSTFPVEVAVTWHHVGEQEYVLAVVRDVKGRREMEEALRETEAQYQALFDQSWDAVYLTTRAGEIVKANQSAIGLFGYASEDLIGLDARELMPRAEDIRAFQQGMAEDGRVEALEAHFRSKTGGEFAGQLSATSRRDAQGRLLGYQWVVRHEAANGSAAGDSAEETPGVGDHRSVLLIDAEQRVLDETRSVLEHAGLRVLTATEPGEGATLFRAHAGEVGATVMATALSETASGKAVRTIRELDPEARIVLVSADDPYAVAERFSDVRISAYLRRPAHPLTLVQTVRDLVAAASNGR